MLHAVHVPCTFLRGRTQFPFIICTLHLSCVPNLSVIVPPALGTATKLGALHFAGVSACLLPTGDSCLYVAAATGLTKAENSLECKANNKTVGAVTQVTTWGEMVYDNCYVVVNTTCFDTYLSLNKIRARPPFASFICKASDVITVEETLQANVTSLADYDDAVLILVVASIEAEVAISTSPEPAPPCSGADAESGCATEPVVEPDFSPSPVLSPPEPQVFSPSLVLSPPEPEVTSEPAPPAPYTPPYTPPSPEEYRVEPPPPPPVEPANLCDSDNPWCGK